MVLALDVHYRYRNSAKSVGVLFDWEDFVLKEIVLAYVEDVEGYVSGEFYRRELPCLLEIINSVDIGCLEVIIIDGYVFLDDDFKLGLGGLLWKELEEKVAIIGVAKKTFHGNEKTIKEIFRGESKKPLYISCIGMDLLYASEKVKNMVGRYRIPDILKQLDIITKEV